MTTPFRKMRRFGAAILLALPATALAQTGVGIGTTAPDVSAALDIVSSSKGALLPRVADATAITTPATGLIVFQTGAPAGFYYNAGTPAAPSWQQLATAAGAAVTASNGLTKTGQDIRLGGTLTLATDLNTNGNNLTTSGTGNVGIGVASPGFKLQVGGTFRATVANGVFSLYNNPPAAGTVLLGAFDGTGGSGALLRFSGASAGGYTDIGQSSTGGFAVQNGGGGVLHMLPAGNVGLGTSSPAAKLDIQGGADSNGTNDPVALTFSWRGGGYRHYVRSRHNSAVTGSGNDLDFYLNSSTTSGGSSAPGTGNVQVMTLESNNGQPRVGIGTSAPAQALDVAGSANVTGRLHLDAANANDGTFSPATPLRGLVFGSPGSGEGIGTNRVGGANAFGLDFYTNFTRRLSISNYGNVGIGTTSPSSTLHVVGNTELGNPEGSFYVHQFVPALNTVLLGSFVGQNSNGPQLRFTGAGGFATFLDLGQDGSGNFTLETNDTPRLTLLGSGANVGHLGLGTTAPVSRFSFGNAIYANAPRGRMALYEDTDGQYFFGSGLVQNPGGGYGMGLWGGSGGTTPYDGTGTTKLPQLYLDQNSSNVGIGTIEPSQALEVAGQVYSSTGGFRFPDNTVQTTAAAAPDNLGNHSATQNLGLNDYDLRLRGAGDAVHGLGYYGTINNNKPWNGLNVDGPVLYGYAGGVLGINNGTQQSVLSWNSQGRVGIGTSSPTSLLDLGNTAGAAPTDAATRKLAVYDNGGSDFYGLGVSANFLHLFANTAPGGAPKLSINNSGNVGIGAIYTLANSPSQKLDVDGTARLRGLTTAGIVTTDAQGNLSSATAASLNATTASNGLTQTGVNLTLGGTLSAVTTLAQAGNNLNLTGTGNVGIGSSAPAARLTVQPATDTEVGLRVTNGVADGTTTSGNIVLTTLTGANSGFAYLGFNGSNAGSEVRYNTSKNRWRLGTDQRGIDEFFIDTYSGSATTTVLRATTSGNVGIGTTPGAKLHVAGSVKVDGNNTVEFGAGVSGKEVNAGKIGYQTFSTDALDIVGAGTTGSNRVIRFYAQGGAFFNGPVTGVGAYNSSDRRLKQDIRPLSGALASVLALRGVRYEWNALGVQRGGTAGAGQVGLIAQEIEQIYPELVNTDAQGFKSVNYAQLTPVLIEALKELAARNTALEAKAAALEGRAAQADADHASLLTLQAQVARLLGEGAQAQE